jgi:hypothetical protein
MNIPDPIEEIPRFEGVIDPMTESKLSESDKILARMFGRQEQAMHWFANHLVITHNMAVETAKDFMDFRKDHENDRRVNHQREVDEARASRERLLKTVLWVAGFVMAAFFEELFRRLVIKAG